MKKLDSVMIFGNGMIAAFDEEGQQIPALQATSVLDLFAARAESLGYDMQGVPVRIAHHVFWKDGTTWGHTIDDLIRR